MKTNSDAATPPSVRKGYAFTSPSSNAFRHAQPREVPYESAGKAKPYRTEGGKAAKAHAISIYPATTFISLISRWLTTAN